MRDNWIKCTSKDHEGETIYLNLDRVEMIYLDHPSGSIVVMVGWSEDKVLHVEEPPEEILRRR